MKLKKAALPLILLIVLVLALGGCGKKNEPTNAAKTEEPATSEQPAKTDEPAKTETKSWTSPPAMQIDTNKTYVATFKTSKGSFTIQLFAKDAPKTVNNFVFLSKEGFYNGVTFHRIIETFMIQTGDPTGTGAGGPGYAFEDEKTSYKYEPGIVAMANAGENTNGSQFFICTGADSEFLNQQPNYTIFGKVTEGMDIVQKIAATPVEADARGELSKPTEKVTIDSIDIKEK
ncbi:peptidylprolyl isomerase [Paenibacillus chibensis]|uniref:Peptidyl-prolyl cis-trans isomerase n=1 Tax=Paenibacillus chibensis TaxID=59846 RepID=A0ABU6PSY3_9BACL|nr:peptidylprolyl isomerase [Paenibacillus chibensis]